jgi:hypothetical protein
MAVMDSRGKKSAFIAGFLSGLVGVCGIWAHRFYLHKFISGIILTLASWVSFVLLFVGIGIIPLMFLILLWIFDVLRIKSWVRKYNEGG